jgi:amidophosphoribosyltransferase
VIVSETCALDLIDAQFEREVEPGEVVCINENGKLESFFPLTPRKPSFCSFEPIYFARPDSQVFGSMVYHQRKMLGRILARECPTTKGDIVIAVPDSGVPMALGYSEESGIKFETGLVRNHYVGRTFIEPDQEIRDFGVRLKLNPVPEILKGKNVVVVDDSLVRGTTAAKIIRMIRNAGARHIHVRIGSPPITHSCFYGVDTPKRNQLLAAQLDVDQIREFLGCDSLGYLSLQGLKQALEDGTDGGHFCLACFNGAYPEETFVTQSSQPTDHKGPGLYAQKSL